MTEPTDMQYQEPLLVELLPDDAILHILSFLKDSFVLKRVALVSRAFKDLAYRNIKSLFFSSISIRYKVEEIPKIVAQYPNVRKVATSKLFSLSDRVIEEIVSSAPNLETLEIGFTGNMVSRPRIAHPSLRSLSFLKCYIISVRVCCPALEELRFTLSCHDLRNVTLEGPHPNIHTLDISQTLITDSVLEDITREAPNLRHLSVAGCKGLTAPDIVLPELFKLDASVTLLNDDYIAQVPERMPLLTELNLRRCVNLVMPRFVHPNLAFMKLHFCPNLTAPYIDCPSLGKLDLDQCDRLIRVDVLNCRNLCEADLSNTVINDVALTDFISLCPNLRQITLRNCGSLVHPRINHSKVEELTLIKCRGIEDINLDTPNLRRFMMVSCPNVPMDEEESEIYINDILKRCPLVQDLMY